MRSAVFGVVGVSFGTLITPLAEFGFDLRDVIRNAGWRRTVIWVVVLAAWAIATLGLAFGLALIAGLDRVQLAD
jgi:allophanate hydrolase subunit 1